jgi:putative flippase GtrA
MKELLHQLGKFASVGVVATVLHVMTALGLNHFANVAPLRANVAAFVVATIWSYLGNWIWTFESKARFQQSAPRFLAMSLGCFGINQAIVYGVTVMAQLPFWVAMIPVVAVVPVFSFWMSRTRIFNSALHA